MVAAEDGVDQCGEIPALPSGFVDGYAERCQAGEVHQQVVHQVFEIAVVMPSDECSERHSVVASKRVVAYESVEFAVVLRRQVLLALYLQRHIEVAHALLKPVHSHFVAALPQELVHLVLMDDVLEPLDSERWHVFRLATHLFLQDAVDVDGLL